MKRSLFFVLFLAACSAETSGPLDVAGGEDASAQGGSGGAGGSGGGAGDDMGDASLVGFGKDGGPSQEPDAGLSDSSVPDAASEVDGAVDANVGELSPELFAGVWDIEETNCAFPTTAPIEDTWTYTRYTGASPDVFMIWNGGLPMQLDGSELVLNDSGLVRRFWLIDQNTLGGSLSTGCPEYVLLGKRQ